jgi:class 3 adenylate cyclase
LYDFEQLDVAEKSIFPNDPVKARDIRLVSLKYAADSIGLSSADTSMFPARGQNWMPVTKDKCTKGTPTLMYIVYTPPNGGTPIPLWCDENGKNGFSDPRIQRAKVVKDYPTDSAQIKTIGHIKIAFDNHPETLGDSVQMIVTMIFIMIMLIIASISFTVESDQLVVQPIERMVGFVKQLSQDPLSAIAPLVESELEIDFVENNLKKLGKLLQISFGDAGSKIIASNIANEGALDVMLAGSKIDAIFGFCDIRNFTDCTECLQEDVMLFVNKIADYVHTAVETNYGSANKNIGDAFLLCWRFPENPTRSDFERIADGALLSFVKVTIECLACPILQKLTQHPKIQERMPGYRVRMGFGLHFGYAIQGAIGSAMKIDASYLSPNVNKCAFLEGSTKEFKAAILLSRQFVDLLSPGVRSLLRLIDVIKLGACACRLCRVVATQAFFQKIKRSLLKCGPTTFPPSTPLLSRRASSPLLRCVILC